MRKMTEEERLARDRKIRERRNKLTAEETLRYMIGLLLPELEAVKDASPSDPDLFAYGEKTAYVECAEIIQYWKGAREFGLDFDVEQDYPL